MDIFIIADGEHTLGIGSSLSIGIGGLAALCKQLFSTPGYTELGLITTFILASWLIERVCRRNRANLYMDHPSLFQ